MNKEIENMTEELLRNQLIDLSLKLKSKELFYNMTSENWRQFLVCPKKALEYVYKEKNTERIDSFLIKKYRDEVDNTLENMEGYIRDTTVTDDFEEKKSTLHQLMMLSKSLNKEIFNVCHKIYNDSELVSLLTLTSDKKYRNAVFYLDEREDVLKLKDERGEVFGGNLIDSLEFYRMNNEQFFIEIKMVESI